MRFMDVLTAYRKVSITNVGCLYSHIGLLIVVHPFKKNVCIACTNILQYVGKTVKTGERGRVHCFPYDVDSPTGPSRTHEQTCTSAKQAYDQQAPVSCF